MPRFRFCKAAGTAVPGTPRLFNVTRSSGRERFLVHVALVEDRDRLEAIVARPAMPEISGAAGAGLDPLRHRDRLAALGAGISLGQIRLGTSHGTLPCISCASCLVLA